MSASYRLSRVHLGSEIDFLFFTNEGVCRSCKFSDEEDFLYRVPLSERRGSISPGEIAGASFPIEEIAERYGLRRGCYFAFAKFTRRNNGKFLSRNVSNVERVCVN